MCFWRQILAHAIQTEGHRFIKLKVANSLENRTELPEWDMRDFQVDLDIPPWDIGTDMDKKKRGGLYQDIVDILPGLDVQD